MFSNDQIMQFEGDHSKNLCNITSPNFPKVSGRKPIIAFFLGLAIIAASIFLGRSYIFFFSFLAFSIFMTLLWKNDPRSWIILVSISAATPMPISRFQIACNLIFAFWFAFFNVRYLFRLPKWIYVPAILAVIGILTSSINWMSGDVVRDVVREGIFAYNFFLAPFLLLPLVYMRMSSSLNHNANLWGLLFCLIIPSTLILISARSFGIVANEWQASLHAESGSQGYLLYQIGRVFVDFSRTGIGFILAALICASAAITVSQVRGMYRLIAGTCLASNAFLLFATASFGSIFAALCGLAAIFWAHVRKVSIIKVILSVAALCCMLFILYSLSPPDTKQYLEKRFEHRVVKVDDDRLVLWARAIDHFLEHPEGVGLTLKVGGEVKSNPHNDYLTYAVSYGIIGGMAYPFLIAALLIYFFKSRKSGIKDQSALAVNLAGLGVIVAIAVNSMTDHSIVIRWYFNVIWSLIWYCYFCSRALHTEPVVADEK